MIDFQSLLKKSWQITLKNRFLWYLGFLSGGIGANWFSNSLNYQADNSTWERLEHWRNSLPEGTSTGLVKAGSGELGKMLRQSLSSNYYDFDKYLTAGVVMAVVLLSVIVYINITAKVSIVRSVFLLNDGKEMGFKKAWLEGHRFFWRRLSFGVVMVLLVSAPLFLLVIPVILLGIYEMALPAIILGAVFFVLLMAYWFYLGFIATYAERILLLEKVRPVESLKRGLKLFNRNWKSLLLLFLILLAAGIGAGLLIAMALTLAGALFFGLGMLVYAIAGQILTIIYAVIVCLVLLGGLIVLTGFCGAFISANYTLGYLEVAKLKK